MRRVITTTRSSRRRTGGGSRCERTTTILANSPVHSSQRSWVTREQFLGCQRLESAATGDDPVRWARALNRGGRLGTLRPWTGCFPRSPSSSFSSPAASTGTSGPSSLIRLPVSSAPRGVLDGFASPTTRGAA